MRERIAECTEALELLEAKIDFHGQWLATGRRPPLPVAAPASRRRSTR